MGSDRRRGSNASIQEVPGRRFGEDECRTDTSRQETCGWGKAASRLWKQKSSALRNAPEVVNQATPTPTRLPKYHCCPVERKTGPCYRLHADMTTIRNCPHNPMKFITSSTIPTRSTAARTSCRHCGIPQRRYKAPITPRELCTYGRMSEA